MHNLLKAEWFKLRKNRAFWTLLVLLSVLSLIYPLLYYFDRQTNGEPQFTGAEFLLSFIGSNSYLIKLGTALLAGFFIAQEYATGVMKTIVSSGIRRERLYLAKTAIFAFGAGMLSIAFPVVSTLTATLLSGFGEWPAEAGALYGVRVLLLTMLYTAAYAAIAALVATLFTDSGKTIAFSLVFFIGIEFVLSSLGSKVAMVQSFYEWSVFKFVGEIGQVAIASEDWLAIWLVPSVSAVLSVVLGMIVFRKKDIK